MKVCLYARVSTEDQNVKQQMDKLCKYAKSQGWVICSKISDEESGRLPLMKRKRFTKLINNLNKYDAVLVYNIDRLTRNWDDESKLEKMFSKKCNLLSISDSVDLSNATGRLMFRIKMAVGCYMPEDMREKQIIGIERAKKEGKYAGGKVGRKWKS